MIRQFISIDDYWGCLVYYDVTFLDMQQISAILREFGCDESDIGKAGDLFDMPNHGLTFSAPKYKMSVTCIGWAEDAAQLFDTVLHEADHIQRAVCSYYDVDLGSEEAAYLQGYIGRQMFGRVERLICPHCGRYKATDYDD